MTNLKTYIEEREGSSIVEVAERIVIEYANWSGRADNRPQFREAVKSLLKRFHYQTLIGLLERDIEMWEGKKKITYQLQGIRTIDHRYEKAREYEIWKSGYNQALSDLITGRRKLIEELKK